MSMRAKLISLLAIAAVAMTVDAPRSHADERPEKEKLAEPIFDGLGSYHRKVTTNAPEAQHYWDQGLCFLFAFNHDEAIRSFQQAASLDPKCAMAWWGIAIANGPHINNSKLSKEKEQAAWQAVQKARELCRTGTEVEKQLIEAAS